MLMRKGAPKNYQIPPGTSFHTGANRPPSSTNRQNADSPSRGFTFEMRGHPVTSGGSGGLTSAGNSRGMTNIERLANPTPNRSDLQRLQDQDDDERYRYLMKHGIVRKVEDEDKIIFAELPQIPGVLVVYRKPSERNTNPERLNLDKRELTHLPLLEGEERLRLLNLQHNQIIKVENLVSLPNLIFLDLYNNEIKEIANLHTVPTLRVLMLGRNHIERIRNLRSLTKLDVLDLHSNKISKIENLNHLSELRVLNLANNLITSVENLTGLMALTELNLRRNLIESVQGLSACMKLQRIFLSNNKIEKMENIASLKETTQLTELALDGNPIASNSQSYIKMCLDLCPTLKNLDLKKVTPEMRESLKTLSISPVKKEAEAKKLETPTKSTHGGESATPSTGANSDTKTQSRITSPPTNIQLANGGAVAKEPTTSVTEDGKKDVEDSKVNGREGPEDDMTPEALLSVIHEEWHRELERLKNKYFIGRRKKDQRSETLVQSGHAEIEGDSMLFIYGNALEVLNNAEFQKSVEQITFQYVRFDNIVHYSNLNKLKKFTKLKKLVFCDNFLYSFIQISKLECLDYLNSITIENNDVANTVLCRTFIVYRFPRITEIDGSPVNESDKHRARKQFQHFDKILSSPSLFTIQRRTGAREDLKEDSKQMSSKVQRTVAKKNIEATQNFWMNVVKESVENEKKNEELDIHWNSALEASIFESLTDVSEENINEKNLRKIANLQ